MWEQNQSFSHFTVMLQSSRGLLHALTFILTSSRLFLYPSPSSWHSVTCQLHKLTVYFSQAKCCWCQRLFSNALHIISCVPKQADAKKKTAVDALFSPLGLYGMSSRLPSLMAVIWSCTASPLSTARLLQFNASSRRSHLPTPPLLLLLWGADRHKLKLGDRCTPPSSSK